MENILSSFRPAFHFHNDFFSSLRIFLSYFLYFLSLNITFSLFLRAVQSLMFYYSTLLISVQILIVSIIITYMILPCIPRCEYMHLHV